MTAHTDDPVNLPTKRSRRRPMAAYTDDPVSIRLSAEEKAHLDDLARILERNRSDVIRLLVRHAKPDEVRVVFSRDDTDDADRAK